MTHRIHTTACIILGAATLLLFALLLDLHFHLLWLPVPIDSYEPTVPAMTQLIANGHLPFTAAFQPVYMYVYTPLYNFLMAPFVVWFGNTLFIHRLISGVFLGAACLLCLYAMRRQAVSWLTAFALTMLLYATWLFYTTPTASPTSMGLFLFLASVITPWIRGFSWPSLLCSILLGILAFYTKQYFAIGTVYVAIYLFLFQSKLVGIQYSLLFIIALLTSLAVTNHFCPFLIDDAILAQKNAVASVSTWGQSAAQLREFTITYAGLLIWVIVYWLWCWYKKWGSSGSGRRPDRFFKVNVTTLRHPAFAWQAKYFAFCFICSTLVVALYVGRNKGTWMTYLFQLMSPFLAIAIAGSIEQARNKRLFIVFVPLILWCFHHSYAMIPKDTNVSMAPWLRIAHLEKTHTRVFTEDSYLLMPLIQEGKKLYANGQTGYAFYIPKSSLFLSDKHSQLTTHLWHQYTQNIRHMIKTRAFDLLLLHPGESPVPFFDDLQPYYRKTETIHLDLTNRRGGGQRTINVWVPRKKVP